MEIGKKTIVVGLGTLLAAMGAWFYKVATTEPVKTSEVSKTEEVVPQTTSEEVVPHNSSVVPAAKPDPEMSWLDWLKSYIPEFKYTPLVNDNLEKTTGEIIEEHLKGD